MKIYGPQQTRQYARQVEGDDQGKNDHDLDERERVFECFTVRLSQRVHEIS